MLCDTQNTLENNVHKTSFSWKKQTTNQGPNLLGNFRKCKYLGRLKIAHREGNRVGGGVQKRGGWAAQIGEMSDTKQGRGRPQEPKAACSKDIEGTAEEGLMWEDAVPGRPGQCVHVDRAVGTFRGLQKL